MSFVVYIALLVTVSNNDHSVVLSDGIQLTASAGPISFL